MKKTNTNKDNYPYIAQNVNFIMVKTSYIKKGSKWLEVDKEEKTINKEFANNVVNAKKFFTNLGGYERHEKSYTKYGYVITTVNSISPDRQQKSVYEFILR